MTTSPNEAEDNGYSNPARLVVATRESRSSLGAVNADAGPSKPNERETLLRAKKRNDEVRRKGEKWSDKLMEETVDRETFKRALRYIHPSQYDVITHERHLNSHCSYPLCSHSPAAPYRSGKRFRISTTNRSITEVDGNKEDGFCSKACTVRSRWVYERLEEAGSVLARSKDWTIELVEDLDLSATRQLQQQGRASTDGASRLCSDVGADESREEIASPTHRTPESVTPTKTTLTTQRLRSIPRASPPVVPDPSIPVELMGDLTIHERPTPSTAAPPSLTLAPHASPQAAVLPNVNKATSTLPTPPKATSPLVSGGKRRAPTAILGEQSKLAQTVLKASQAINPEPQINPDSEEEGEHPELEWEKEVGLDWGGGGEDAEEDVWAAMREAREMAEGQ